MNTTHVDKKDRYKSSVQDELKLYSENLGSESVRHYLSSNLRVGVGKPTTCAYQFLNYTNENADGIIYQYFLYDGFKVALRLHDFACKTFYGHHSSHRTALPIIVKNNKVYYRDDNVSVFAWGKS